ncbi:FIC domain-containing protein [Harpegnathos saltator]|uniref:FIC domain-containing protein n=1 Tax=Harpegnathos saltator TaxID=610380 RepID=E2C2X4_HARSA|nr:FIC domain-containing protein [Harpegnathos saltator]
MSTGMKERNTLQKQLSQEESCHDALAQSAQDLYDEESSEYESESGECLDETYVIRNVPKNNTKKCCKLFEKFLAAELEFSEKDNAMFARMDEKCIDLRDWLMEEDIRWQGHVLCIHHSATIEGNTCSPTQIHEILKSGQPIAGKPPIECHEIIGLDAAINQLPLTGRFEEYDLWRVHWNLFKAIDPASAGKYRKVQVFVGSHVPPSWKAVPKLMVKWCHWMNQHHSNLHPVVLAAIAHFSLVFVHPFVDGNGKISRLFMNLVLAQHGFPPTIIQYGDRSLYYDCLERAEESGDIIPLIRFITKCTDRTLDFYLTNNLSTVDNLDLE